MPDDKPITGKTKHGELTLDQIAAALPGLGPIMQQVGERYWVCYYAAKGGNWGLAAYELRSVRSLFVTASVTRPKYAKMLADYTARYIEPLLELCAKKDWAAFESAYHRSVDFANELHRQVGHGEIVWKLPPEPPKHFDLGPQK
jgi:hypothetical protein